MNKRSDSINTSTTRELTRNDFPTFFAQTLPHVGRYSEPNARIQSWRRETGRSLKRKSMTPHGNIPLSPIHLVSSLPKVHFFLTQSCRMTTICQTLIDGMNAASLKQKVSS